MLLNFGAVKRGVGFCINPECDQVYKDVFLFEAPGPFRCSRCFRGGRKVMEYGETDNDFSIDFWQVRLEFNYDPILNKYRSLVIISDETMSKEGNIYTLYSPVIKTDKRALLIAESVLGNLMRCDDSIFSKGYIPKDNPIILDFDKPLADVKQQINTMYDELFLSRLRKSA